MKIDFYDDYFSIEPFSKNNDGNQFKDNYIRSKIKNGRIYKFIAFTEDEQLNLRKLEMLAQHQFWASCFNYFRDKRELLLPFNKWKVYFNTGKSLKVLNTFFSTANEANDVSCFTYEPSDFMWTEYANNKNGFCMEFELIDSDKFFPIVYLDKNKLDYTNDIINLFSSQKPDFKALSKLAILPWVTKDLTYQAESELRFLCGDIYDSEDGPMSGRIAPYKKKLLNYKGIEYSFEYAGIVLKKVYIGSNCTKKKELQDICQNMNITTEKI